MSEKIYHRGASLNLLKDAIDERRKNRLAGKLILLAGVSLGAISSLGLLFDDLPNTLACLLVPSLVSIRSGFLLVRSEVANSAIREIEKIYEQEGGSVPTIIDQ